MICILNFNKKALLLLKNGVHIFETNNLNFETKSLFKLPQVDSILY